MLRTRMLFIREISAIRVPSLDNLSAFCQLFPQNKNCAKPPRFAMLGTMGEKQIGAAGGAEARLFDLLYARVRQILGVGERQVKMGAMAVRLRDEQLLVRVKGGADLADKRLVYLITANADAGADSGEQIGGVAAKFSLHRTHHLAGNILDRPLPARVSQPNRPANGIIEEDGGAIGVIHGESAAVFVGDDRVGVGEPTAVILTRHPPDPIAMHEGSVNDCPRVAPDYAIRQPPIGIHAILFVSDGDAEIEGVKWSGTYAPLTTKYSVLNTAVVRKTVKLEIKKGIVYLFFHKVLSPKKGGHRFH